MGDLKYTPQISLALMPAYSTIDFIIRFEDSREEHQRGV